MLEHYFVKPSTLDRIRGSWLGSHIESYVDWLEAHGYPGASTRLALGGCGPGLQLRIPAAHTSHKIHLPPIQISGASLCNPFISQVHVHQMHNSGVFCHADDPSRGLVA